MNKSKAVLLLKLFDNEEIKRFGEFLDSPYFNNNSRVAQLFNELKKYHPDFSSKGVEKERLFKKLFPFKPYNEQVIKNLITELFKLGKEFLSVNGFKNDAFEKAIGLINRLSANSSLFEKEVEAFEKLPVDQKQHSEKINLYKHLVEEKKFTHNIYTDNQSEASVNLEKSGEYLTLFFLKSILRLSVNIHTNYVSFNKKVENNFADVLVKSIDIENFLEYMCDVENKEKLHIKLAYYALVSVTNVWDDKAYETYHDLLYGNLQEISRDEAQLFLHFMESICAQKINAGRADYYKGLFETFQHEISLNLYSRIPGTITMLKFRNICLAGIRIGEYDWVEGFINEFEDKLQESNRENIVQLARAQLNFEKGNFEKSLEIISKIKPDQIYFKIDVRSLNLMLLYELGYYDTAMSFIESYKRMLTRNPSLTEQYGSKNINFANSVSYLIKIKHGCSNSEKESLLDKIRNFDNISNKKWLSKKIGELM